MADITVTSSELARNVSRLLDEVEHGNRVVIERRGRPIAQLEPHPVGGRAVLGRLAGRAQQLVEDEQLMAPLPDWPAG